MSNLCCLVRIDDLFCLVRVYFKLNVRTRVGYIPIREGLCAEVQKTLFLIKNREWPFFHFKRVRENYSEILWLWVIIALSASLYCYGLQTLRNGYTSHLRNWYAFRMENSVRVFFYSFPGTCKTVEYIKLNIWSVPLRCYNITNIMKFVYIIESRIFLLHDVMFSVALLISKFPQILLYCMVCTNSSDHTQPGQLNFHILPLAD